MTARDERIRRAWRYGGVGACGIDGCTEPGTLEHVTAHLDRLELAEYGRPIGPTSADEKQKEAIR